MVVFAFAEFGLQRVVGDVAAVGGEFVEVADDAVVGLRLPEGASLECWLNGGMNPTGGELLHGFE